MDLKGMLRAAYGLLPPPLSALPAKYHAPVSLLVHSLSAGVISHDLARLAELEEYEDVAFVLGLTHDIHQKLVEGGLATLKEAKMYIKGRLEELGLGEYYRYVDDAIEVDACGKGNQVRGLPPELSKICHVGDMAQGTLEGYDLLEWLQKAVKEVNADLTVRFYGVMIPQPFARSYIMQKIYDNQISKADHLALASPWGLYVITYEDELPEIIDASWDDLRIDDFVLECREIKDIESSEGARKSYKGKLDVSKDEASKKMWSKFASMFLSVKQLSGCLELRRPSLPASVAGLFLNIRFTDVEFRDVTENAHTCPLCGLRHSADYSFNVNMYPKIAGINVTTEKWNRKLPGHIKVRGWEGQWRHGFGLDPLCTLDAVAIRELKVVGLNGVLSVSIAKPLPIELLQWMAAMVRNRGEYRESVDKIFDSEAAIASGEVPSKVATEISVSASIMGELSKVGGVVIDYVSATASVPGVGEPTTDNLFGPRGELPNIGFLTSLGLYPVKYLEVVDTSIPNRLFVTTHGFALVDFPVTSDEYRRFIPWVAKLLEVAGEMEKKDGLDVLQTPPQYAPLRLLSLGSARGGNVRIGAEKISKVYNYVSKLLSFT